MDRNTFHFLLDHREQIRRTFDRLVGDRVPVHLVSFAEGTRLTRAKLAAAQAYAGEQRLEAPRHTLIPRSKGFSASVEGLRGHLDAIYDITIAYEKGVPTLRQFIEGFVECVHIHVRRFPIDELPESVADLRRWLLDRWREKDDLLEHYYTTGSFPES